MNSLSRLIIFLVTAVACELVTAPAAGQADEKPNVVLIITDDQGFGDIAAHGNERIQTPNLDRLWSESIRLTNYHVDPTCSPTRSALLSGRYSTRTGVWHTIMGRSLMAPAEVTLGEVFATNGYRTGMFGKWHLGDNYPCRAEDQGFQYVVRHGGGGVGQGPDYWGNDYFDDTYWRNGEAEKFDGYCTDVWFDEAIQFIERNREAPFFCYVSTNAPHGPYLVAEKYSRPYAEQGVAPPMDAFYGMITNIDENISRLRAKLDELGLADNTILIFTTDNGTAAGVANRRNRDVAWQGFNAGMRGQKGSEYDGGHRVPFFIYWPEGQLTGGRDVSQLCAHVDVSPTLAELCQLTTPEGPPIDGTSLKEALYGDANVLRDRSLIVHSQRLQYPEKWRKCSVMTDRWRLVNRTELYDIKADPAQTHDVADSHPEIVRELSADYEVWWRSLQPAFDGYVRIGIGSDSENPVRLMSHDWHAEEADECSWHQNHVQNGHLGHGPWSVDVEENGRYAIRLFRWPPHLNRSAERTSARVKFGEIELSKDIELENTNAEFLVDLSAGPAFLQTWLTREDGQEHGAYFVEVERLDTD